MRKILNSLATSSPTTSTTKKPTTSTTKKPSTTTDPKVLKNLKERINKLLKDLNTCENLACLLTTYLSFIGSVTKAERDAMGNDLGKILALIQSIGNIKNDINKTKSTIKANKANITNLEAEKRKKNCNEKCKKDADTQINLYRNANKINNSLVKKSAKAKKEKETELKNLIGKLKLKYNFVSINLFVKHARKITNKINKRKEKS